MARRTLSVKERTHSRIIALNDGFDDSVDKILNRLIDFYYRNKDRVDRIEGESTS